MSRLSIDGQRLGDLADRVRAVVSDLETSGARADEAAAYVGARVLERAIHDFSDGWSDSRAELVANVRALADYCDAVNQTFSDIDAQTAAKLRGES